MVPVKFPEPLPGEVTSSGRSSGVTAWSQRCEGLFQSLCCLLCSKRALYSCQLEQRLTSWSALTLLVYVLSLSRRFLSFPDSFSRFRLICVHQEAASTSLPSTFSGKSLLSGEGRCVHGSSEAMLGKVMMVKSQRGAWVPVLLSLWPPACLLEKLRESFCPVSRGTGIDSPSALPASDSFGCIDKAFSFTGMESPQSSPSLLEVPSASRRSSYTLCFFSCNLKTKEQ